MILTPPLELYPPANVTKANFEIKSPPPTPPILMGGGGVGWNRG